MPLVPAPTRLRAELEGGQNRLADLDDTLGRETVDRQLLRLIRQGEVRVLPVGEHVTVALESGEGRG